ncbi:MAG: hypothetical protein ACTSPX_03150 [Candidatus Thorarchaeota archaeon]
MIVRKRLSDAGNLVWEFELETAGEAVDIVLIMRRGIEELRKELRDHRESLEYLQVWDKAVGCLVYAQLKRGEVYERRFEYPRVEEVDIG